MVELLTPAETERLVATRRDLHAHPELAYAETRTAALVAERLTAAGYEVTTGVGGTGVTARKVGAPGGKTVLLRADMDALPVQEESDVPYASQAPGIMHACGHDGHTAALLTVAERLAAADDLPGDVLFVFQPAEEGRGGARRMIADGLLERERVDAAFGVHLWNDLPAGTIAANAGPVMAAVDRFDITVTGVGGHGAMPEQTVDPVVAACHIVTALQTIASRNTDPLDSCVVTVGQILAGDNFNVIPREARLTGTARSFSREHHTRLPGLIERIASGVAAGLGCTTTFEYERIGGPTINDPAMAALARAVATELLGADAVRDGAGTRTMAGEDFSEFLSHVPGAFLFVGSRNEARGLVHPHHSKQFDFDESALPVAVLLLEGVARSFLGEPPVP